jgi:lipopolysaccharide transport system ATP-binding protein
MKFGGMMGDTVIKVDNLSKKYILNHQQEEHSHYKTFQDVMVGGVKSLVRSIQNPKSLSQSLKASREEFWALKDLSFEIKQGDRVGIIGRNGAGKSTLLKILSRIVEPTTGRIEIKGRVASLLEVGTGFHPELTGRENIFLNGAILGMSKAEIVRKFDEIVAFAEIEKFLDTPVKRYSSGMYVRLAFAVAAHLEPEILILDEVLAVGDVKFQKKCFSKMQDISKQQGRTILFVSHSMESIQKLCSSCCVLDSGKLAFYGNIDSAISLYLSNSSSCRAIANEWIDLSNASRIGSGEARFLALNYSSLKQSIKCQPYTNGPLELLLDIQSDSAQSFASLAVTMSHQSGLPLVNMDTLAVGQEVFLKKGSNRLILKINELHLTPGIYIVGLWLHKTGIRGKPVDHIEHAGEMEIVSTTSETYGISTLGCVTSDFAFLESSRNCI